MADARRIAKLEKAIAKEISEALVTKLQDPRAPTVMTITNVKLTGDLSKARVKYSVLGGEGAKRSAARMFESSHGMLQSLVAQRLDTRSAPSLMFEFDDSLEKQAEISALLDEALAKDREAQSLRGEVDPESASPASEDAPDASEDQSP